MPYGLATAGDVLTAVNVNLLPRGRVAYAQAVANQTGVTTITDATSLSVTFTAVSGRNYRTTVFMEIGSTVAGDLLVAYITTGANTQVMRAAVVAPALVGGSSYSPVMFAYNSSALSGSTTHKVRIERNAGTGTMGIGASATFPAFIMVEDLGA